MVSADTAYLLNDLLFILFHLFFGSGLSTV